MIGQANRSLSIDSFAPPVVRSRPLLRGSAHAALIEPRVASRSAQIVPLLYAFFCFFPYPAIPIGNNTAIQIGNVLTLLLAPSVLLNMSWHSRRAWMFPILIAPLTIAAVKVGLTSDGDLDVAFKSLLVWTITCLTIPVAQELALRNARAMLAGIAVAAVVHVAVGVFQHFKFAAGELPLEWIYINPSFLSVQENASIIALYVQRPFGLFPEPSAMTSSLAPWMLLWFSLIAGLFQIGTKESPGNRAMWAIVLAGALVLFFLAQSGHAFITLAAMGILACVWVVRSKANARDYFIFTSAFVIVVPAVIWALTSSLSSRVGGAELGNDSWQERFSSLVIGLPLSLGRDFTSAIFGSGPGITAVAIKQTNGLEAVWSVLLSYIYDTGIVGFLAVCAIGAYLLRVWQSIRWEPVFGAVLAVWLVGITLTTSYEQLLPIWIAFAFLTVWPEIVQSAREGRMS